MNNIGQVIGCASDACSPLNITDYTITGDASFVASDSSYLLTPDMGGQSGAVWSLETVDLSKDFEVVSKLNLGSNISGADGIAFVLQPLSSDQGGEGGGIGYAGIDPSVAVEFDTWNNGTSGTTSNHAAVIFDGVPYGTHSNLHVFSPGIEDGIYHDAVFSWVASTKTLTVSWDGTTIITMTKDIVSEIFSGNPNVYYGFTAATGSATNNQSVKITKTCAGGTGFSPITGYQNWYPGEPNNATSNEDFAYIVSYPGTENDGKWDDHNITWEIPHLIEVESLITTLTDYKYLGQLNGHSYFESNSSSNWNEAKAAAETAGGYLAIIRSKEENDTIKSFIDKQLHIGLYQHTSDPNYKEPDGGWKWVDGKRLEDFIDGYTDPLDADGSGVVDYKEVDDYSIENFCASSEY